MRFYGYGDYDWDTIAGLANPIYWFYLEEGNTFVPSIEPQILLRPGNYATFGTSQVGAMNIVGGFGYTYNPASPLTPEAAFSNLFKALNPSLAYLGIPRTLKCVREDGVALSIPAILAVPNFSSSKAVNVRDASFVCTQPFFTAQGFTTGTGGFV